MFILAFIDFAHASDTFVQIGAETAVSVPNAEVDVRVKLIVDAPLVKQVSLAAFAEATPTYGEMYAGPAFHFGTLSLGVSVGIETAAMPARAAVSALWSNDRFVVFAVGEYGGSGLWYKGLATARFGHATLGVLTQRFDGVGPRFAVKSQGLEFWAAPMYDYEDGAKNIVSGINWVP